MMSRRQQRAFMNYRHYLDRTWKKCEDCLHSDRIQVASDRINLYCSRFLRMHVAERGTCDYWDDGWEKKHNEKPVEAAAD